MARNNANISLFYLRSILWCALPAFFLLLPVDTNGNENKNGPALSFHRVHQGLTSNQVTGILQDVNGFIWVGTDGGLNRYNGIQFDTYSHESNDENSLSDNYVGYLFQDSGNNLWIGTRSAVNRYRIETDNFERYRLSAAPGTEASPHVTAQTMIEDRYGTLWVSGGPAGLYFFDEDKDRFVPVENLKSNIVNTVVEGEDQTLWLTTRNMGLHKYHTGTGDITTFRHDPADTSSLSSDVLDRIVRDPEGNIWIGSRVGGVNRLITQEDGTITFRRYMNTPGRPLVLGNNAVQVMHVDSQGDLWIGNDNGGLHLYDRENDRFHIYSPCANDPHSLTHESISAVLRDDEDRLWVGTALTGLNVADPHKRIFHHYQQSFGSNGGLNNNIIRDFREDENGNIWVATDGGGLNFFNRQNGLFTAYMHDPEDPGSIQSDVALTLERDEQNRLWVGSYNGGLDMMADEEQGTFKSFQEVYEVPDLSLRHVFGVAFDKETDYVWIANFGENLVRFDRQTGNTVIFTPVSGDDSSMVSTEVNGVFLDSNGNLWIPTLEGLARLKKENKKKGRFERYLPKPNDPASIPSLIIRHIIEDSQGTIWVATGNGLARYDPEMNGFYTYDQTDGLPANELRSLEEDDYGDIWIGTINGLSRFNPKEEIFTNYTTTDGLQGDEFSRNSAFKMSSGELLFGGMDGFNLFHPDNIHVNPHAPRVYLTNFRLFNRDVRIGAEDSPLDRHIMVSDTITLSHDQNVMTFEFVALNYTNPEGNEYAYKMEGFESDWNYVGQQRSATYTNLNPGTYHFRVKASNNDGVWNKQGAVVALVVVPPFWQTTWFYLLLVILIAGMVVTGYAMKVRSIKERNRMLEMEVNKQTSELQRANEDLKKHITEKDKVYSVLAHDLRNPLFSIIGYLDYLRELFQTQGKDEESNEEVRGIINTVYNAARNAHQLLENLLQWSKSIGDKLDENIAPHNLSDLAQQAVAETQGQAGIKNITVRNKLDPTSRVLADKNMIQTVFRNLIANAIKFSPQESEITLDAKDIGDYYDVSVTDTGMGMNKEEIESIFSGSGNRTKKGTMGEKGSGFGLMLCEDFVIRNNGKIRVDSEPGKGSSFRFTLQKADGKAVDS